MESERWAACAQGEGSEWAPFLASLPARTLTPVLWPDALRGELLRGSPVLAEARQRQAALEREWGAIAEVAAADPGRFSPGVLCCPLSGIDCTPLILTGSGLSSAQLMPFSTLCTTGFPGCRHSVQAHAQVP